MRENTFSCCVISMLTVTSVSYTHLDVYKRQEYIKELNELAHQEDTTRPTTSASNQMGDLNFITDAIAWNRYDGSVSYTHLDVYKRQVRI